MRRRNIEAPFVQNETLFSLTFGLLASGLLASVMAFIVYMVGCLLV